MVWGGVQEDRLGGRESEYLGGGGNSSSIVLFNLKPCIIVCPCEAEISPITLVCKANVKLGVGSNCYCVSERNN